MVDSNGSSPSRTHLYESLYLICQLTDQLIHHLDRLKSAKILMPGFVEQEKEAARELRSVVAASAAMNLQHAEMDAAAHHQKNRTRIQTKLAQIRPAIRPIRK